MDDNTFDDLLKRKFKNYEDQTIDPSALDDFHERMSNFQPDRWYGGRRAVVTLAASFLVFTGINGYILVRNLDLQETGNITYLSNEHINQNKIDSLLAVIDQIQCTSSEKPAFIPINSSPKYTLRLLKVNETHDPSSVELTYIVGFAPRENISEDIYTELEREGLATQEKGEVFLLLARKGNSTVPISLHSRPDDLRVPIDRLGTIQMIAFKTHNSEMKPNSVYEEKTSLTVRNVLEKHYYTKLGIQIGAHGDLMKGFFSEGTGVITPRIGLTADWLLSPRISIESGIDYGTTQIHFAGSEIHVPDNSQLGNLESATLTNRLLSIPLSFKYRRWIFDKSQLVVRAGYTPYMILSKQYQYNYVHPDSHPDSDVDHLSTVERRDENKFFGNTITVSAGLAIHRKKNKNIWEASLFYEHGLGNGFERNSMQLIGLRTAYWIRVK